MTTSPTTPGSPAMDHLGTNDARFSDFFRQMEKRESGQSLQRQPTMIEINNDKLRKMIEEEEDENDEDDEVAEDYDEETTKSDDDFDPQSNTKSVTESQPDNNKSSASNSRTNSKIRVDMTDNHENPSINEHPKTEQHTNAETRRSKKLSKKISKPTVIVTNATKPQASTSDQNENKAESDDEVDGTNDDDDDDDSFCNNKAEKEESKTKDVDITLWLEPKPGTFEECDIRLNDDEFEGGKPEAERFRDLHFFFRFIYDRFYANAKIIMDSQLPSYDEWKRKRKVIGFRTAALKDIDYALKAYIQCVDTMKAVMRNCLLVFYDANQDMYLDFKETKEPVLPAHKFNCGPYSVLAAWDLFKIGSTLSDEDWKRLLDDKCPAQFFTKQNPDTRHLTDTVERKKQEAYNTSRRYINLCLAEYFNKCLKTMGFGSDIEWKKVKVHFLNRSNGHVLNAFDPYTYYINPKVDYLANLMDDRTSLYISNRRIVAEPILWLIYVYRFLLDKQAKLSKLCFNCSNFGLEARSKAKKIQDIVSDLGKSAKEESDALQKLMAKIPFVNDLKETFKREISQRDSEMKSRYTTTLDDTFLDTKKDGLELVARRK